MFVKSPSIDELAEELRRRDEGRERESDAMGLVARWRRRKLSRALGRADRVALLRAYRAGLFVQHG